ncbi:MAG: hypothetical protein JST14_11645 [Bacteroidetes bacterium]|nr:hypothetical protein [Bacteroidota bacterium]
MAQERKKRTIVIASVLKPVDDTRMLEKMGLTLAAHGCEVIVIGYPSLKTPQLPASVRLIALPAFNRLSSGRWQARWQVFRHCFRINPDLLIVNTHELLLPAVLLRLFRRTPLVYDVRENYKWNILYSGSFRHTIRYLIALMVRLKEILTSPFIGHFFLAEPAYQNEFKFHHGRFTLLGNKAIVGSGARRYDGKDLHLIFTGTLDESTGVFDAIQLTSQLHQLDSSVHLTIMGYGALADTRRRLQDAADSLDFIRLAGISQLVPHSEILEAIGTAHAGFLLYKTSPHVDASYPTKLYEYLSARLPIILNRPWAWIPEFENCRPFLVADSGPDSIAHILESLKKSNFYTADPPSIHWSDETPRFLNIVDELTRAKG